MNLLTLVTTRARLGLVQTITYIKLPTTLAYETQNVYSISASDYGESTNEKRSFAVLEASISLGDNIPNLNNCCDLCPISRGLYYINKLFM